MLENLGGGEVLKKGAIDLGVMDLKHLAEKEGGSSADFQVE